MLFELSCIGNLGKDAEINENGEKRTINFSVCASSKYKNKDGVEVKTENWVACFIDVFGEKIPNYFQYLKKGTKVFVRGKLKVGIYNERPSITVNANMVELLGGNNESSEEGRESRHSSGNYEDSSIPKVLEDDLPF